MDHSEFREKVECGHLTVAGVSQYIMLNVATRKELDKLRDARIFSAVEIIEGRYHAEQVPVVREVVEAWNKRLGFECIYEDFFR